jgi:hypothetical protein
MRGPEASGDRLNRGDGRSKIALLIRRMLRNG